MTEVYSIVKPALAVPINTPATVSPLATEEITINKRSPAATGTLKFEAVPNKVVPTAIAGVTTGARSTPTPVAVKILLPAGAR